MNPLEMTYTPPTKTTRASERYPFSSEEIRERIKGYKIIAFRPPLDGETWLTDAGFTTSDFTVREPRFILERERTDTERINGLLKFYGGLALYQSRDSIDSYLDNLEKIHQE